MMGDIIGMAGEIISASEAAKEKLAWPRGGNNRLPKVILGVKFTDGIEAIRSSSTSCRLTPSVTIPTSPETASDAPELVGR